MGSKGKIEDNACFAEAIAASRLRCKERLLSCVKALPDVVNQQDAEGGSLTPYNSIAVVSTEDDLDKGHAFANELV